ncbi:MAG: hypothetical protein V3S07_01530 [Micropepsaceae bacterium]
MGLKIETFNNRVGGNAFYKAVTHPLAAGPASALVETLKSNGPVAIYDPHGFAAAFDTLYPLEDIALAGLFVQDVENCGREFRGASARVIDELEKTSHHTVFIADFDTAKTEQRLQNLYSPSASYLSFDGIRLPEDMLTVKQRYLSTLNFATNFAFFRDQDGHHTRLATANYWGIYGSKAGHIWYALFGEDGRELCAWREPLPAPGAPIVVDSKALRERFSLPEFTGQLFIHVVGAAGHDIVKYALDTYGDDEGALSCTHDANSWPSNLYAGLPAPDKGEEVVLWVQNSHPVEIAPGEIGLGLMGGNAVAHLKKPIAPFATYGLCTSELLPDASWPQQIEIHAGKHVVRPRYEVVRADGRRNIAHPNVEREDLVRDEQLPRLRDLLGKGFILPAPILPIERYTSLVMPTPMSTAQQCLPLKLLLFDASGEAVAEHSFGNLSRSESIAFDLAEVLGNRGLESGYGHMELVYDFDAGNEADGWLHGLFRYIDRKSDHRAETSFGAHVFNTLATYKNEPQSYKGPPPGLTTRLFLRVGASPYETMCHLIYPASKPWHSHSDTKLTLMSIKGKAVAERSLRIPCSGSQLWRVHETFSSSEIDEAGAGCYVIVRDTTCRLFGYHGLINGDAAFSLDHMFGF